MRCGKSSAVGRMDVGEKARSECMVVLGVRGTFSFSEETLKDVWLDYRCKTIL